MAAALLLGLWRSESYAAAPVQGEASPGPVSTPVQIVASPAPVQVAALPTRSGPIILVAATPAPTPRPARPVPVRVSRLELPTAPETIPVVQTQAVPAGDGLAQWEVPRYEAGQHNTSPACGRPGNTILAGHSIWYDEQGVFEPLLRVAEEQIIRCENDDGRRYNYRVVRKWESPYEDGSWLNQNSQEDLLTLYTCRLDLTGLVVVQAERVE